MTFRFVQWSTLPFLTNLKYRWTTTYFILWFSLVGFCKTICYAIERKSPAAKAKQKKATGSLFFKWNKKKGEQKFYFLPEVVEVVVISLGWSGIQFFFVKVSGKTWSNRVTRHFYKQSNQFEIKIFLLKLRQNANFKTWTEVRIHKHFGGEGGIET